MKVVKSVHTIKLDEHERQELLKDIEVFLMKNPSDDTQRGVTLNALYCRLKGLR